MDSMLWLKLKGELLFSTTRRVRFDVLSVSLDEEVLLQKLFFFLLFFHVRSSEVHVLMLDHKKGGEV